MPSIEELKRKFQEIRDAIRAELPVIATTLTVSAKALAERRIVEKGFGAKYSQVDLPSWFLRGKELNQKGTAYLNELDKVQELDAAGEPKKGKGKTNWGKFRQAQGLQAGYVDLHYSNKMFANMQPLKAEMIDDVVRAPLGATNKEAQDKMNWNRDRYGDFIGKAMTSEDFNLLGEIVMDEVLKVLERLKT